MIDGLLLDTCIFSELRKSRTDPGVVSWMQGLRPDEAFLSALTIGEIRRGVELHRAKDAAAATALVHQHTVVTRNLADFERSGANTLNPFS